MSKFRAIRLFLFVVLVVAGASCKDDGSSHDPGPLLLVSVSVGSKTLSLDQASTGVALDKPVVLWFDDVLDTATVKANIVLSGASGSPVPVSLSYLDGNKAVSMLPYIPLDEDADYRLHVGAGLRGQQKEVFDGAEVLFSTLLMPLALQSVTIDAQTYHATVRMQNVALKPAIVLAFSHQVSPVQALQHVRLSSAQGGQALEVLQASADGVVTLQPVAGLQGLVKLTLTVDDGLVSVGGNAFPGFEGSFYTMPSPEPLFPVISDDELLTLVQRQTFKYFWDFAHPASGMARERDTSGDVVTTGGTGFGLMAIVVGMERGFITRSEGVARLRKIIGFLSAADRFHGAWPHWLNGSTGKVQPFSTYDDGGDLVETSFLVAGMLAVRQYLDPSSVDEQAMIDEINTLWNGVEWDWYTRGGEKVLYWHWSPNHAWAMNHKIQGYNEALVTYVLAAASGSYGIGADVYKSGWASGGGIVNGKPFYGIILPVGYDYGGPLFFAHYSFMGLDPRNLSDAYADYWTQNVAHSLINRAHCVNNPNGYVGYGASCWGLTASDNHQGYSAHSPTNDLGVISPTAAVSSMPYTPVESMEALRFFYYRLGDRLWGDYGFYDAFQLTEGWTAGSYLAIDQGPMVVMVENYRTGLLWNLFMTCPEVLAGLNKLGFTH
ncbi:MAG: glucoamylase family protein [Breznakibacter sp.]